jgi:glycosyltransferase involved in cell wall biosynthesis
VTLRICSITPHQLLNNPRIVREADALAAAGHEVTVVAVRKRPEQSAFDRALARERAWMLDRIDIEPTLRGRPLWLLTGARQKVARALWRQARRGAALATAAYCRTCAETRRRVLALSPDLVIAHTQPMLGVACEAARRLDCRWGFDCEDILSEEYGEGIDDEAHQALVRFLESRFIPAADYVTTASPEFGPWLAERYGVQDAVYVANAPSRAEAPEAPQPGYPDGRPYLSLYWFSISIGPKRGVEDAIRALPLIDVPVQLHLRGRVLPGYDRELRALIGSLNVSGQVEVHDLEPPGQVVRAAAAHDIGLVLTQPCCENHELAVPNKIYAYVMAGLVVGATATRGHRSVLNDMPGIWFDYPPGDHAELARQIRALAREPGRLRTARREAFRLGQHRFNWELGQRPLVALVNRLRPRAAGAWHPVSPGTARTT